MRKLVNDAGASWLAQAAFRARSGRWSGMLARPTLASFLSVAAQGSAVQAGDGQGSLFEKVAGSWSGAGTATLSGGSPEPIRCRADYTPNGRSQLGLTLRCASDAFNLQVQSDISLDGDRVNGTWTETSLGASGDVAGSIAANELRVVVSGACISAQLSMTLRGNAQAITLNSQGQVSAAASIMTRRTFGDILLRTL